MFQHLCFIAVCEVFWYSYWKSVYCQIHLFSHCWFCCVLFCKNNYVLQNKVLQFSKKPPGVLGKPKGVDMLKGDSWVFEYLNIEILYLYCGVIVLYKWGQNCVYMLHSNKVVRKAFLIHGVQNQYFVFQKNNIGWHNWATWIKCSLN